MRGLVSNSKEIPNLQSIHLQHVYCAFMKVLIPETNDINQYNAQREMDQQGTDCSNLSFLFHTCTLIINMSAFFR